MKHAERKVFLHPGELVFAEPGTHVHTILGSCVAICLWHPLLRIGGMCHYVLPTRPPGTAASAELEGRYGDEAMQLFDQVVKLHHTEYRDYHAKIFGGTNSNANKTSTSEDIGKRNIAKAKQLLSIRQIDIKAAIVGEVHHQRIVMDFSTGHVWVRHPHVVGDVRQASDIDLAGNG